VAPAVSGRTIFQGARRDTGNNRGIDIAATQAGDDSKISKRIFPK
jgi:hypothetical protein